MQMEEIWSQWHRGWSCDPRVRQELLLSGMNISSFPRESLERNSTLVLEKIEQCIEQYQFQQKAVCEKRSCKQTTSNVVFWATHNALKWDSKISRWHMSSKSSTSASEYVKSGSGIVETEHYLVPANPYIYHATWSS